MTLAVGTVLGSYEIVSVLGVGGMGEVYRARDHRLGRDIALKTLPATFTSDADRLARFEREARALAALNHPNIATIHGFEDLGGLMALLMELVEGDTLADRILAGHFPVRDALAIARQLADALDAAHERGIVHRDLKPANIKITPSGHVKVLDFGLAKPVGDGARPDLADALTMPATATGGGLILGTAAYMSPEQARGEAVDKRADIWAFGCVLYEMLTGSRVFAGSTSGESLAEVLKTDPDWSRLPADTPANVRQLLDRCLRKERSSRLRDIADARPDMEETAPIVSSPTRVPLRPRERAMWVLAVTALLVATVAVVMLRRPAPEEPERRFEVNVPARTGAFALSPDGASLAFVAPFEGPRRLWVQPLDSLMAHTLAGTEGAKMPFWSPDGRSIGFFTDAFLKRISLDDGTVQTIVGGTPAAAGASWGRDTILYSASPGAPIWRNPVTGGEPVAATRFEADQRSHTNPHFLPDGEHFLFFVNGPPETRGVHLGQLGDISNRRLVEADDAAVFGNGYLFFVRAGKLLAQAYDPGRMELRGNPMVINEQITAGTVVSASAAGPFAYREPPSDQGSRQLVWVDRKGQELQKVVYPDTMALGPALSRDGRYVAVFRVTNGNVDIWSYFVERRQWDRVTVYAGDDIYPLWSPDNTEIIFGSRRGSMDLYRRRMDTGSEELLLTTPQTKFPTDWSGDGRFVIYNTINSKGNVDVSALPLDGTRTPVEVVRTDFNEQHAQFSPDGKWIAYQSDRTGRFEIYVRPFLTAGADVPVSTGGGSQVRWSPKGSELFYIAADDTLMAVSIRIAGTDSVELGTPRALFPTTIGTTAPNTNRHQYMVSPDGESFVMNSLPESSAPSPLTVVVNWKPPQ